jgi:hypothetical protein
MDPKEILISEVHIKMRGKNGEIEIWQAKGE